MDEKKRVMSYSKILNTINKYKKKEDNYPIACWVTLGGGNLIDCDLVGVVVRCFDGIPWCFVAKLTDIFKLRKNNKIDFANIVANNDFILIHDAYDKRTITIAKVDLLPKLKKTVHKYTYYKNNVDYLLNCADSIVFKVC